MKNIDTIGFKRNFEINVLGGACCRRCTGLERQRQNGRIRKQGRMQRVSIKEFIAEQINFRNDGLLIDDRTISYV